MRADPRLPRLFIALFLLAVVRPAGAAVGQVPDPEPRFDAEIRALLEDPRVAEAFALIEETDEATMRDQVELTEIPAPPFGEEARAAEYLRRMTALGVDSAWIDEEGNAIGLRRGARGNRVVAISAHLDTVFPEDTDVTVRIRGDTLFAPGISDDGRGLAAVLAVLRALEGVNLRTEADLLFIGTVGEEGLGDLRGVKHLFGDDGPRIDAFISVDGTDDSRITNMALGSHRYRVVFRGPGGHSWGAFGLANPAHALGRAVARFDDLGREFTETAPARTSYNVGRIGGGTSVNSIPFEAWMEVDMRSEDQEALLGIDAILHGASREAVDEANRARRDGPPLEAELEMIGNRPSGEIPPSEPFVQRAIAASRALGIEPELTRSSTDSNVPISLGIPSMTLGGGGIGGRAHALDEFFVNRDGPLGIQRVLLILLAEAGVAGLDVS